MMEQGQSSPMRSGCPLRPLSTLKHLKQMNPKRNGNTMQIRTFDTSYKQNQMCEGETPLWSEHNNKHHFILIGGIIVGYIFDDEDVFELFVGANPNYTIEQIEKDPVEVVNDFGMSAETPDLFCSKDEKFVGAFNTLDEAIKEFENQGSRNGS